MDFERVLRALLPELESAHVRYAAIGGFGMAAIGFQRATMDLDFVVHRDDLGTLHGILTRLGYGRLAQTENVSHYAHADAAWGSIDLLHAFRAPSVEALQRARPYAVFSGACRIRAVSAEDAIGFKVQAMANNPKRRTRELADIEALIEANVGRLDWAEVQGYFELFELGDEGRQLRERLGHAE